jgi:hypothetical protein
LIGHDTHRYYNPENTLDHVEVEDIKENSNQPLLGPLRRVQQFKGLEQTANWMLAVEIVNRTAVGAWCKEDIESKIQEVIPEIMIDRQSYNS